LAGLVVGYKDVHSVTITEAGTSPSIVVTKVSGEIVVNFAPHVEPELINDKEAPPPYLPISTIHALEQDAARCHLRWYLRTHCTTIV
jgi:hypothetical protein